MTTLSKLAKHVIETAKENIERDGSLMPVCFLVYPKGKSTILPLFFKNNEEKQVVHKKLAHIIKTTSPLYVVEVMEGWLRHIETTNLKDLKDLKREDIEKLDKSTVLLVFAMSLSERMTLTVAVKGNKKEGFEFEEPIISKDDFEFALLKDKETQQWLRFGE